MTLGVESTYDNSRASYVRSKWVWSMHAGNSSGGILSVQSSYIVRATKVTHNDWGELWNDYSETSLNRLSVEWTASIELSSQSAGTECSYGSAIQPADKLTTLSNSIVINYSRQKTTPLIDFDHTPSLFIQNLTFETASYLRASRGIMTYSVTIGSSCCNSASKVLL